MANQKQNDNNNLVCTDVSARHIGSMGALLPNASRVPPSAVMAPTPNQTPQHAVGLSAVDPALPAPTGRSAEQTVSGGGSPYALTGAAAEQLAGGRCTNGGSVAAEQPTPVGLRSGANLPSSQLDTEEARLLRDIAVLRRQQEEEWFWAERMREKRVAALRQEYEALQAQATPREPPPSTGSLGALGPQAGGCGSGNPAGVTQGWIPVASAAVQPAVSAVPGSRPRSSAGAAGAGVRVPSPPGLAFLGREPPSAARSWGPRKEVADLSSLKQATRGVTSGERSSYFDEYRQGRVPGSPSLDELRAKANMENAPSRIGVGGTRRVLFTSDAGASRGSEQPDAQLREKAMTGVANSGVDPVLVHVDGQMLPTKRI